MNGFIINYNGVDYKFTITRRTLLNLEEKKISLTNANDMPLSFVDKVLREGLISSNKSMNINDELLEDIIDFVFNEYDFNEVVAVIGECFENLFTKNGTQKRALQRM